MGLNFPESGGAARAGNQITAYKSAALQYFDSGDDRSRSRMEMLCASSGRVSLPKECFTFLR